MKAYRRSVIPLDDGRAVEVLHGELRVESEPTEEGIKCVFTQQVKTRVIDSPATSNPRTCAGFRV